MNIHSTDHRQHLRECVAQEVMKYLNDVTVIGVGTGRTVNAFIRELAKIKHQLDACVPSSKATEVLLREVGLPVLELNAVDYLPLYVDSADEVVVEGSLIKGGGGALLREKIVASAADQFICIAEEPKLVSRLGKFPIPVEVIPMARSFVARELVRLGGDPVYRQGFETDNHNIILDVHHLEVHAIETLELLINEIPGVVENGLFGRRRADRILMAMNDGSVQYIDKLD